MYTKVYKDDFTIKPFKRQKCQECKQQVITDSISDGIVNEKYFSHDLCSYSNSK